MVAGRCHLAVLIWFCAFTLVPFATTARDESDFTPHWRRCNRILVKNRSMQCTENQVVDCTASKAYADSKNQTCEYSSKDTFVQLYKARAFVNSLKTYQGLNISWVIKKTGTEPYFGRKVFEARIDHPQTNKTMIAKVVVDLTDDDFQDGQVTISYDCFYPMPDQPEYAIVTVRDTTAHPLNGEGQGHMLCREIMTDGTPVNTSVSKNESYQDFFVVSPKTAETEVYKEWNIAYPYLRPLYALIGGVVALTIAITCFVTIRRHIKEHRRDSHRESDSMSIENVFQTVHFRPVFVVYSKDTETHTTKCQDLLAKMSDHIKMVQICDFNDLLNDSTTFDLIRFRMISSYCIIIVSSDGLVEKFSRVDDPGDDLMVRSLSLLKHKVEPQEGCSLRLKTLVVHFGDHNPIESVSHVEPLLLPDRIDDLVAYLQHKDSSVAIPMDSGQYAESIMDSDIDSVSALISAYETNVSECLGSFDSGYCNGITQQKDLPQCELERWVNQEPPRFTNNGHYHQCKLVHQHGHSCHLAVPPYSYPGHPKRDYPCPEMNRFYSHQFIAPNMRNSFSDIHSSISSAVGKINICD